MKVRSFNEYNSKKLKNDPKIKSKLNVRIDGNIENKKYSTT